MKLATETPLPPRSPHTASGVTSLPPRLAHTHATVKVNSSTKDATLTPLPGATGAGKISESAKFQSRTTTRAQMHIPECAPEPVSIWLDLYPIDGLIQPVPECAPKPPSTSASGYAWIDLQPPDGDEEDVDTPERTPNSPHTPYRDPAAEEETTQAHAPAWYRSISRHLRVVLRRLSMTRFWGRKKL